ncbi:Hypothetical predicted protein [Olea europaea subsp. europaea]|uniref:Uncharacterized protein n=1 Tax=Olea europaea subsp. europaea TaxID=158383 RepID=A0A8S0SIB3_OLEEU|nr:Hypothetical predicted protein [Olea europaea subsp. europaea]
MRRDKSFADDLVVQPGRGHLEVLGRLRRRAVVPQTIHGGVGGAVLLPACLLRRVDGRVRSSGPGGRQGYPLALCDCSSHGARPGLPVAGPA